MLGKLIKHEFKETYKTFFMLYAAILILSVVNYGLDMFDNATGLMQIVSILFMIAFILCAFFMSTIALILIVTRFYRNLLGDEGYLMHTLPVKKSELIISKWIVAGVWTICSTLMVVFSILILIAGEIPWSDMFHAIGKIYRGYDGMIVLTIVTFLCILISVMAQLMLVYASMAVGQVWQKHRVLGAFLAFFGINIVTQAITDKIMQVFMAKNAEEINNKISGQLEYMLASEGALVDGLKSIGDFLIGYLSLNAIVLVVCCIVYFFVCNYFMKNKLNLE